MKAHYTQVTFSSYATKPVGGPSNVHVTLHANGLIETDDTRLSGFTVPADWMHKIVQGRSGFAHINGHLVAFYIRSTSGGVQMTEQQARDLQHAESGYPGARDVSMD